MTINWEHSDPFLSIKHQELDSKLVELVQRKVNEEARFLYFCGKVIEEISDVLYGDILTIEPDVLNKFRSGLNCMSHELRQRIRAGDGDKPKKRDVKKFVDKAYRELTVAEEKFKNVSSRVTALQKGRDNLDFALEHLDFYLTY